MTATPLPSLNQNTLRRMQAAGSPWPGLVKVAVGPWTQRSATRRRSAGAAESQPSLRVRVVWQKTRFEFVAELKRRSIPSVIEAAILQAKQCAEKVGMPPMVIVPFLDESRLDRLAAAEVSGLDLSGNGIVCIPGRLLLRRSGQPNRYPESQPMRFAYRGATSLVPRGFLCRRSYESVGEIKAEIERRRGAVALSTVSKALARMADDVLIDRTGGAIALLQPDALLDKLAEGFQPPKRLQEVSIKADLPLAKLFQKANRGASQPRMVLSGASSQDRYAAGRRSDQPLVYCNDLAAFRTAIGPAWQESERFADVTIIETDDRTPFFDARSTASGLLVASPVQAYLELTAGDKRDREMAQAIRELILRDLK